MCGIVGLHLRTAQLYPRLGELLTGMLCEMGDRGSDSAGVAVYGDPIWSPPGRACVSVLEVEPNQTVGEELDVDDAHAGDPVADALGNLGRQRGTNGIFSHVEAPPRGPLPLRAWRSPHRSARERRSTDSPPKR